MQEPRFASGPAPLRAIVVALWAPLAASCVPTGTLLVGEGGAGGAGSGTSRAANANSSSSAASGSSSGQPPGPTAALAVIVSDKYGGMPGVGGSLPLGSPPVGDTWVCVLTGVWGQLGPDDSVGVYNGPGGWYLNVTATSGAQIYASAACAATATKVNVTAGGQVLVTGADQATLCAIAAIHNDGSAWASAGSYEQISWGDDNPNQSPSTWWSSSSADVVGERKTVCATLATLGHFHSPGVVDGTSTSWLPPADLISGGLCGLTLVQGDFSDNRNADDGVFLTPDPSTGEWILTASTGMRGNAYCVW